MSPIAPMAAAQPAALLESVVPASACVWVTRPQPQADEWAAQIQQAGWRAQSLPLIDIRAPHDLGPLHQTWKDLAGLALVMFVSPSAVQFFFASRPTGPAGHPAPWPDHLSVAATGPGTVRALQAQGVPPSQIITPGEQALQFDSETLWPLLAAQRDWGGARTLIVRGAEEHDELHTSQGAGRHWLGEQLRQAGAQVNYVAAYCRCVPALTPTTVARLSQAVGPTGRQVWLLSSSQAVQHLTQWLASPALQDISTGSPPRFRLDCALATHPRIAQAAELAGFATVVSTRPTLPSVLESLRQLA